MSMSIDAALPKKLPVINANCALRRNVRVQPYGRCSICSLKLPQCHAWQSSALSFLLVILLLVPLATAAVWAVKGAIALALVLLVLQGTLNHKRTDELISGQHKLFVLSEELRDRNAAIQAARDGLEKEVAARTQSLSDANVALAKANLELAKIAEEREKMLLDVSHDLRTPLTAVKGAAQNLLDGIAGPLDVSQREYVEIVRDHAERLMSAVTKLLNQARSAAFNIELEVGRIELGKLAADAVKSLQPIANQRGVKLAITPTNVEVQGDAAKLRQVIENLVGNALKFTPAGGEVSVAIECTAEEARLSVRDTGHGMEELQASRVFDRFYRGNHEGGTGLGLAITRDLVRLHRGDITLKSTLGRGSEFSVCLPRSAA